MAHPLEVAIQIVASRDIIYILFFFTCILIYFKRGSKEKEAMYALCFFILAYCSTGVLFTYVRIPRIDRYLILIGVSTALVFAYRFLDITRNIFIAWVSEIILITQNIIFMTWQSVSPYENGTLPSLTHFYITDILNYTAYLVLLWNWRNGLGCSIIFRKRYKISRGRNLSPIRVGMAQEESENMA